MRTKVRGGERLRFLTPAVVQVADDCTIDIIGGDVEILPPDEPDGAHAAADGEIDYGRRHDFDDEADVPTKVLAVR